MSHSSTLNFFCDGEVKLIYNQGTFPDTIDLSSQWSTQKKLEKYTEVLIALSSAKIIAFENLLASNILDADVLQALPFNQWQKYLTDQSMKLLFST